MGFLVCFWAKMTARQVAYLEFLKTPLWDALRKKCYELANWTCHRCGAKDREIHAHHTSYPERWEDTTQEQLECLCFECHGNHHGPKPRKPKKVVGPVHIGPIATLKEAKEARREGRLKRHQFVAYRKYFLANGTGNKRRKKRSRRARRAAEKREYWKNSVMGFRNQRPNWVNRDTSSN